jgi:hypothetical protein
VSVSTPGLGRRVAADLAISIGVLAVTLATLVGIARRALFYPEAFSERLATSFADPRVAAFVADRMAGAVVKQQPDLTPFRPLIAGAVRGAVSSASFQALARSAARTAHKGLFSEGAQTAVLSVPDVGVLLRSALATANPALAEKIPLKVQGVIASIGQRNVDRAFLRLWEISRRSQWLAGGLFVVGVALVVAGIALAARPRRALARLGLDLLVAGACLWLLRPAGRALVALLPREELGRHAASGLWDAFTGPLTTWALVFGGIGLVLAAAGRSLGGRFEVRATAARVVAWLEDPPGGTRGQLLRGLLLVTLGAFAMLRPAGAVSLMVLVFGGLLAFVGLRGLFDVVLGELPAARDDRPVEVASSAGMRVSAVLGIAALLGAAIWWLGRPKPELLAIATSANCNGAAELCGRRLDQVVFPGTHNAMSAADRPDWLFAQHERGIAAQLEDGARALLIDVHYGIPVEGRIKTDLDSEFTSKEKLERAVGKEGFAAAMRVRDRITGREAGKRGVYLCHGFCELGAIPFPEALAAVHQFLVKNPDEVLILVVEDYVSAADLAAAFAESGLDGLAYRGASGPWPTLREMIDGRERIVVLTESGRPGVDWIRPAFEVMQETPYHFKQPADFSCAPNRGGTKGSLFLVNNWIDTTPAPKASNAAIVNAFAALLKRAKQCQAERGRLPTVIAVDFYKTGDLFNVARSLNGLPTN